MLHIPVTSGSEGNACVFLLKYGYELFGRLAFEYTQYQRDVEVCHGQKIYCLIVFKVDTVDCVSDWLQDSKDALNFCFTEANMFFSQNY